MRRSAIPVLLALLAAACSGAGSPSPSAAPPAVSPVSPGATGSTAPDAGPVAIDVVVADGAVSSPLAAEVPLGSEVLLRISSDVSDEVHLHGYDLETEVAPGAVAELRFTAASAGVFEVEFHESGLLLLRLTVAP